MAESTIWWLLAGAAVVIELITGTFYLLMLAIGLAAGALAAHAGLAMTGQLVVAALVGGGAVAGWHVWRGPSSPTGRRVPIATSTSTSAKPSRCRLGTATARHRSSTAARTGRSSPRPAATRSPGSTECAKWSAAASSSKRSDPSTGGKLMEVAIVILVIAVIFVVRAVKVVPPAERMGGRAPRQVPRRARTRPQFPRAVHRQGRLQAQPEGIPLDVPSQICITRDNTQLQVDGILYFQVTDPMRASYGSSNYIVAITQLAQTTLRSVVGKLELDKTFEERDIINAQVVAAIDEAALNWGVKVLRYEIKDLTPPKEILHAMQAQITAEREKRA
jgi:hypothetical protein